MATCLRAAYEGCRGRRGGERQPLQGPVTGTSLSIKWWGNSCLYWWEQEYAFPLLHWKQQGRISYLTTRKTLPLLYLPCQRRQDYVPVSLPCFPFYLYDPQHLEGLKTTLGAASGSLIWVDEIQPIVARASDSQCRSSNSPGFDPSILRHSEIWGAADVAVLKTVRRKKKL